MPTTLLLLLLLAPDRQKTEEVQKAKEALRRYEKLPYEQEQRSRALRDLGDVGSLDSTQAIEALLADAFSHLRDEAVSALVQLKRKRTEERAPSLALLVDLLLRRREPETRIHIATALGLIGDRAAVEGVITALEREKDPKVVAALARALARLGDERAFGPLSDKAHRVAAVRAVCLDGLSAFPNAAETAVLYENDGDDAVRAAVIDLLAKARRPVLPNLENIRTAGERTGIALADALPAVQDRALGRRRAEALLQHPSWRVRAAAIAGVVALRDAALLPDLVQRLEEEEGRLRNDAWQALRALTGKEIPPDPEQWRAVHELGGAPGGPGRDPAVTVAYFGLPVFSRRIAFVFDVSGSMRDGGKIEAARERFAETAAQLGPEQHYDLFVTRYLLEYPPRPREERCFGKLVAGKSRAAVKWLGGQEAKGGGAFYDTIRSALADEEVDTIYLLSDGVPSFGSVRRDFRILQEIGVLNRWRRVVIHTVLLGSKGTDRKFMEDLAALTGGTATVPKG